MTILTYHSGLMKTYFKEKITSEFGASAEGHFSHDLKMLVTLKASDV